MTPAIAITIPKGRLKSEWMGVPIPGERPLILQTEQVAKVLADVTVTDAALLEKVERAGNTGGYWSSGKGEEVRALEVTYRFGKTGKGRTVFYDRAQNRGAQILIGAHLRKWAQAQREAGKPQAKVKRDKAQIQAEKAERLIKRLEKEKKGLYLRTPKHPLIPSDYNRCGTYLRDSELRWHQEKPKRKRIARIAGLVLKCKITRTTGYKMLREIEPNFLTFSKLRTRDRERFPYQDDYWKQVHRWVYGMAEDVSRESEYRYGLAPDGSQDDPFKSHARARLEYLADKRQAEAIDSQIAAIRELTQLGV